MAGWHERRHATGERVFFRGAERPEDVDAGVVELTLSNDIEGDWVVNIVNADGWGGSRFDGPVQPDEILSRQGMEAATRIERRNVDHLLAEGVVILTDVHSGERRRLTFTVDRRKPANGRAELRLRDDGLAASNCAPLPERPRAQRWLGGADRYRCDT